MSLQYYDINIGTTQDIQVAGKFIYYLSGVASGGDPTIEVQPDSGNKIRLRPGQSFRLADTDKTPTHWRATNVAQSGAITGTVMVGDGDFRDTSTSATITGGTVTTIRQPLSTITDMPLVSIGTASALLVSDPTQRILRIRNSHATATLYIGSPAISVANAAIVLKPGDVWIEEDAAGATWWAISDTIGTTVNIQGVK